jgi:hypothetical protein
VSRGHLLERDVIRIQIGKGFRSADPDARSKPRERGTISYWERHGELFCTRYLKQVEPIPHANDLLETLHAKGIAVISRQALPPELKLRRDWARPCRWDGKGRSLLSVFLNNSVAMTEHNSAAGIFLQSGAEDGAGQRTLECAAQNLLHLCAAVVPQLYRIRKLFVLAPTGG